MPGRISYNGIHINFQNEWVRFNPRLASNTSHVQAMSGISQTVQFFEQEFISTQMRLAPGQDEIQLQRFFEYANDGSTFELWRDRDLGTYISFEGGGNSATVPTITPRGLQTNDKVAGTFTNTAVADAAWFLDPSTGLMTVVPDTNNIPRFEAGKYGQHAIRIDGAAANLITKPSGPFDGGGGAGDWNPAGAEVYDDDTTETLSPRGGNDADKITNQAGGNSGPIYTSATAKGNEVLGAAWLKTPSGTSAGFLKLTGTGGGSSAQAITVTSEWQIFTVQADTSGLTGNLQLNIQITTGSDVWYVWGTRLYDSAEFDLGTVGALSTAAVTRGADKLLFATSNIVNRDKGTIAFWFNPAWAVADHDNAALFQIQATSGSPHLSIRIINNGAYELRMYNGDNSLEIDTNPTAGTTQDAWTHLGFTYDTTVATANFVNYEAGTLVASLDNGAFNPKEVGTSFAIGSAIAGTSPAFGAFDEIIITKDVKPASWFKQIASRRFAIGEGRNYWSSVRLANLTYARQALRGGRSTIPLEFEEVIT